MGCKVENESDNVIGRGWGGGQSGLSGEGGQIWVGGWVGGLGGRGGQIWRGGGGGGGGGGQIWRHFIDNLSPSFSGQGVNMAVSGA